MKKWIIKKALRWLVVLLKRESVRNFVVQYVNKKINLPKMNEMQEERLIDSIYQAIVIAVNKYM